MDPSQVQWKCAAFVGGDVINFGDFSNGSTASVQGNVKGWIYFAQLNVDGPIKIGKSVHPRRRVSALSSLSPYSITLLFAMRSADADVEEQLLHERLAADRIKGEWFAATAVLEEMQRLADRLVPPDHLPAVNSSTEERALLSSISNSRPSSHIDDLGFDVLVVLARLRRFIGDACGMIQVPSALALAGFSSPSYHKHQLVARALRDMGWERGRYRFNGGLLYAYARGTQLEREVMLTVERGVDDRLVVKRREP